MKIYLVTNDHRFYELYFENKQDAELYAGSYGCAVGLEVYEIDIIPAGSVKLKEQVKP